MRSLEPLLKVEDLTAGYGKREIIRGVNLSVGQGEIVALIGHNGAGKSTLLKSILGLIPIQTGRVYINDMMFCKPSPRELKRLGVSYMPQGDRVFRDLSVLDNLLVAQRMVAETRYVNEAVEVAYEIFPVLKKRLGWKAGSLSGGEQQMLALASAIIGRPRLLLLDEPSVGLAEWLARDTLSRIQAISEELNSSVLVVEQRVVEVLRIATMVYVLRNGTIAFCGGTANLVGEKLREVYL